MGGKLINLQKIKNKKLLVGPNLRDGLTKSALSISALMRCGKIKGMMFIFKCWIGVVDRSSYVQGSNSPPSLGLVSNSNINCNGKKKLQIKRCSDLYKLLNDKKIYVFFYLS